MVTGARRVSGDHRFFLISAILMAVVVVAGFSMQLAMGRSTFAVPAALHVHALVFFGWTAFYVLQNALVARGSIRLHRRLGWIGAFWATAVVVLGIYTTVMMVRRGATPFFFKPNYFLFMNVLTALGFGALVAWAIVLRRRTDWHRRLFLCAMAMLIGPAFGRLVPLPLVMPHGAWAVYACVMLFPLAGAIADRRRLGRVHPAYWCGIGVITALQLTMDIVSPTAPGLAVYRAVTAGTPGAAVAPMDLPPPPPPIG